MKQTNFGLCAIVMLVAVFGLSAITASPVHHQQQLVGANKCTWGPTYWCGNLTNAKGCNAVRHCIQTVWETKEVPVDNDSICQICKDMVTQARDQLRSNETMEELKEVFDGSCNLIPIKIVKKECCKLADNFIPELVEALSSQMNPDQVCSVAGLCNNAEIDELLEKYYSAALQGTLTESIEDKSSEIKQQEKHEVATPQKPLLTCGNCLNVASVMTQKFQSSNRDDILENILHLCGEMSSFSDACANIVLTYFNDIYDHIKGNLEPQGVCHLSGVCAGKYHQHPEDPKEEEPIDLMAAGNDDIPCELCQQLVHHLRDVLVANTTELEFKQVMQGLCNQTKGFRSECLSIVDQYYHVLYEYLVQNLDANGACFLIGVCPKGSESMYKGDIMPLLPSLPPAEIKVTIRKKLGAHEPKFTQEEIHAMTLPIDHLMGAANPSLLVENGELCTLCEYMLHFVQESLATPATEEEIKRTVGGICDKFASSIRGQCHNFVEMYGDAVIALLIQGLNPRDVCPKLQMCPQNVDNHDDMEVFSPKAISDEQDSPTCPLCLFAVEQAQAKIKDDKSKKNIENVLNNLCNRLPEKLKAECVDFVQTYSSELIDMLITDFKPQEICVSLKLCPKSNNYLEEMGLSAEDSSSESHEAEDDTAFNEIDSSDERSPVEIVFQTHAEGPPNPNCLLCEELVKLAEKRINKNTSKENIKQALENSCDKLRKNLQVKCHKYVDKYGDKIADLLIKEMEPKLICTELGLCLFSEQEDSFNAFDSSDERTPIEIDFQTHVHPPPPNPNCEWCQDCIKLAYESINKTATKEGIIQTLDKTCLKLRQELQPKCRIYFDKNADKIADMIIKKIAPPSICTAMRLCLFSEQEDLEIDEALKYDVIALPTQSVMLNNNDRFTGLDESMTLQEPPTCVLCEFIMTKLEAALQDKTEQDEIKKEIEQICKVMPKTVTKSCTKFIDQYANMILSLIGTVPPKQMCQQMQLCLTATQDVINDEVIECGVCHGVSASLLPYFRKYTEHDNIGLNEMINVACENVPAKYYSICSNMVHLYGKSIMHLSESIVVNESNICSQIGKCYNYEKSNLAFARISG